MWTKNLPALGSMTQPLCHQSWVFSTDFYLAKYQEITKICKHSLLSKPTGYSCCVPVNISQMTHNSLRHRKIIGCVCISVPNWYKLNTVMYCLMVTKFTVKISLDTVCVVTTWTECLCTTCITSLQCLNLQCIQKWKQLIAALWFKKKMFPDIHNINSFFYFYLLKWSCCTMHVYQLDALYIKDELHCIIMFILWSLHLYIL